jgi:hypothetical protein
MSISHNVQCNFCAVIVLIEEEPHVPGTPRYLNYSFPAGWMRFQLVNDKGSLSSRFGHVCPDCVNKLGKTMLPL